MKVIVAGSRSFNDFDLAYEKLDKILQDQDHVEIVSGTARGADQIGEAYAAARGFTLKRMPPDWSQGKGAGYKRNMEMAEYADACVVFWDGKSKGSRHMIDIARKYKLPLRIIKFKPVKELIPIIRK